MKRTNNHPRIFFGHKRMHQNKKRPHRYVFLSHQNKGRNKKADTPLYMRPKKCTNPKKNASSLILPSSNLTITWLPVSSAPFEQQRVSSSWPCSKLPCHCCHLPAGCGSQDPLAEVAASLALGKNRLRSTCRRECNIYHVRFYTSSKKTHG